jgi:hypothetical protein
MAGGLLSLFATYLIYPILTVVMVVVAAIIAKKNGLLKSKRLITYTLVSLIILVIPALLGFLGYHFMPYAYIVLIAVYIVLGAYNDRLLPWAFNKKKDEKKSQNGQAKKEDEKTLKYRAKIIFTLFQLLVAMLLFVLVFNLCNELKYGLWASTCMISFVLPTLLLQTYRLFIHIPMPFYKVWKYDDITYTSSTDDIDHSKLKVVRVELFKQEDDLRYTRLNVKVPEELLVGQWIKLLFDDFNKRTPHEPIDVYGKESTGWIFYVKAWVLAPRRYLDHELTVKENRIREKHLIVAKRVKYINEQE